MAFNELLNGTAAAARTVLGLIIGTNVQAWNSNLDTLSSYTPDNDSTLAANSSVRLTTQQAVKGYVDNYITGLVWKQAVRVATTTSGTLSTAFQNGSTVDGVVLATNDRILLKNQATQTENGIYIVNATGAPTRTTDADTGNELVSATVLAREGTTNQDTVWTCSNNSITIGATNIVFAQISGAGTYTAGTGLTLSGNQFSLTTPVSVANGGLGATTLTQYGVLVGNGTSAVSITAAGTANHVLTANASANPTFQALPTASSGESILGSPYTISSSSFSDTGLSVTLPSAGTYFLYANVRGSLAISGGGAADLAIEFYNSTDSAAVTNSETQLLLTVVTGQVMQGTAPMTCIITVAASKTIKLYAKRNSGPTFTASSIESDASGRTRMGYVKLAS